MNGFFVDATHAPAVAIIHAIIHAKRLSNNKITANDIDVCTLQRRVAEAHGQTRSDIQLQQTGGLFDQFQRFGIGDARVFMIDRLMIMRSQISINLWTRAVDHHQTNSQAVQQPNIVNDTGKVLVFNGFAAQHNDKRFSPMGIYIGDSMAESLYQFGSTFLHHGKPSMHDYS
ncbi:hypothetical protein D3C75_596460 [compost metagenome]